MAVKNRRARPPGAPRHELACVHGTFLHADELQNGVHDCLLEHEQRFLNDFVPRALYQITRFHLQRFAQEQELILR